MYNNAIAEMETKAPVTDMLKTSQRPGYHKVSRGFFDWSQGNLLLKNDC
jgi:hypothetical protein